MSIMIKGKDTIFPTTSQEGKRIYYMTHGHFRWHVGPGVDGPWQPINKDVVPHEAIVAVQHHRDTELVKELCRDFRVLYDFDEERPFIWMFNNALYEIQPPYDPENETGKYQYGVTVVTPGVYTLPNGDPGYPDSADFNELGASDTLEGALQEVFTHIVKSHINIKIVNQSLDLYMDESEEAS